MAETSTVIKHTQIVKHTWRDSNPTPGAFVSFLQEKTTQAANLINPFWHKIWNIALLPILKGPFWFKIVEQFLCFKLLWLCKIELFIKIKLLWYLYWASTKLSPPQHSIDTEKSPISHQPRNIVLAVTSVVVTNISILSSIQ